MLINHHGPALLVGVTPNSDSNTLNEAFSELEQLLLTLGIKSHGRICQTRHRPRPRLLIGTGKAEELKTYAQDQGISLIVFEPTLNGLQLHNLAEITKCQVVDRNAVILDIFAKHARSKQAKTQVEIARLQYLLPRLTHAWSHFGRQQGGGVHARGMGETQIEIDRRRARQAIAKLKSRLESKAKSRQTQRKAHFQHLKVSLVGYTNSGKTCIMQRLTKDKSSGEDKLFATLDTCTRGINTRPGPSILVSDTVGFIRDLPRTLLKAFRSTLEELLDSNLLLHVVDLSHPEYLHQEQTTETVLAEISADKIPVLKIFNKIDLVDPWWLKIVKKQNPDALYVSAKDDLGFAELYAAMVKNLTHNWEEVSLKLPASEGQIQALIADKAVTINSSLEDGHYILQVKAPAALQKILEPFRSSND